MTVVAALIAATVALVAAAVSFAGFVIGKDLKTTEFRQDWINAQRDDLSSLICEAKAFVSLTTDERKSGCLRKFDLAAARISLRENPTKPEWTEPLAAISRLRISLLSSCTSSALVDKLIEGITHDSRIRLKTEWDRVRSGEKSYQSARKAAFALMPIGLLAIAILLYAVAYGRGFIVIGRI